MPISIVCEYECDLCHIKESGFVGRFPTWWVEGLSCHPRDPYASEGPPINTGSLVFCKEMHRTEYCNLHPRPAPPPPPPWP